MKIFLNSAIVDKLKNMSQDIKTYVNMNSIMMKQITNDLHNIEDELNLNDIPQLSEQELNELIQIRNQIKKLTHKLETKLNEKSC